MTQVIIDDVIPRTQLVATAGQTVFNTNWTANAATDINVYARADGVPADDVTQLVSSSDYNVTFIGGSQTVRVTFLVGRTLDDVITIARNTPADRMNLYINTNFVPSMLNEDFGILTLVDQQAQMYDTVIAPHYNVSATIDSVIDVILPVLDANQIWAMNPTRTAFIAYDVPASGGLAPDNGKYILQQPDADLPDAQAISALASGIIVGTTTTGVLLSRVLTGTVNQIVIANGTGIGGNPTVSISDNPIIGGTAGMGIPQGTTAQRVIPSSGIGLRYNTTLQDLEYWDGSQWVQISDPVGEALTAVDDTNVTIVLGGSPLTALVNATSLTLGWTGELSPVRGGTGVNNGTSTITLDGNLETSGAFNSIFTMTGATNVTFPVSGTLATTSQLPTPAALSKTDDTNVTLTLGGSPLTALLQATSLTLGWAGLLSIARGGTGVASVTTAPTASAWAGWDVNSNLSANNLLPGFSTTVTAAGTTTLTVASAGTQEFTGGTTQTVVMPVTSTLTAGHPFKIINNSSGNVTVNSSGGNNIITMAANTTAFFTCVLNSGTTAASWNSSYLFDLGAGVLSITGTANQVIASASTGNITLSLPQSIATSSSPTFASLTLTAPLTLANGGSSAALTASNGGIVYSTASAMAILAGTATARQMLQSGLSTTPAWSTTTWPSTTTINRLLWSSAANVISDLATANSSILVTDSGGIPSFSTTIPAFTTSSITFNPTTGGVVGTTTNDNTAAGKVGEFVTSAATATAITNNTFTNVTSISLTAGDWDVWASIKTNPAAGTLSTVAGCSISTTSATFATDTYTLFATPPAAGAAAGAAAATIRLSLSGTTTVYLVGIVAYTVSTLTINGTLSARRRR